MKIETQAEITKIAEELNLIVSKWTFGQIKPEDATARIAQLADNLNGLWRMEK